MMKRVFLSLFICLLSLSSVAQAQTVFKDGIISKSDVSTEKEKNEGNGENLCSKFPVSFGGFQKKIPRSKLLKKCAGQIEEAKVIFADWEEKSLCRAATWKFRNKIRFWDIEFGVRDDWFSYASLLAQVNGMDCHVGSSEKEKLLCFDATFIDDNGRILFLSTDVEDYKDKSKQMALDAAAAQSAVSELGIDCGVKAALPQLSEANLTSKNTAFEQSTGLTVFCDINLAASNGYDLEFVKSYIPKISEHVVLNGESFATWGGKGEANENGQNLGLKYNFSDNSSTKHEFVISLNLETQAATVDYHFEGYKSIKNLKGQCFSTKLDLGVWPGIYVQDMYIDKNDLSLGTSLKISNIIPNSFGEKSGLKVGQRIFEINGNDIKTSSEYTDLVRWFFDTLQEPLEILAGTEDKKNLYKIAKPKKENRFEISFFSDEMLFKSKPSIGIEFSDIPSSLAKVFEHETKGVMVVNVLSFGPAARAGLEIGDIIVEVNGHQINKKEDWQKLFSLDETKVSLMVQKPQDGLTSIKIKPERRSEMLAALSLSKDNSISSRKSTNKNFKTDNQIPLITASSRRDSETNALIVGKVTDNVEVAEVTINGEPVRLGSNGSFETSFYVPRSGKTIEIVAFDSKGNKAIKSIKLERGAIQQATGPVFANLNPSGKRVVRNENALALIIGVADYQRTSAKAAYADKDAQTFYDYAMLKLGIPAGNIKELVNQGASRVDISLAVKDWIARTAKQGKSDVYVFFAGHGLADQSGEEMYLLPADGEPRLLSDSSISRNELFSDIAAANPRSVTVFLDTCYSGTTRGTDMLVASRPIAIRAKQQNIPDGFTVFTAAGGDQTAKPLEEAKHGMFSYFLMKGMEGDADSNRDNQITAAELHEYVEQNVVQQSGGSQVPELQGDASRVLVRFQ